jgi:lysophospholipase L1-like esterase
MNGRITKIRNIAIAVVCGCLVFEVGMRGQQATPQTDQIASLQAQLEADRKILADWPALARYREDNAKLPPSERGQSRVVFMGDSITDFWGRHHGSFFPGKSSYINRGIGGQVTGQMLLRFRQDVILLNPKVVVILAGTNDIPSHISPEDTENNLVSMVELARVHGIKVVLASLLPVSNCYRPNQTTRRPLEKLQEINQWIKSYCRKEKLSFLDYFAAMSDGQGMLKCDLTVDGVHPNAAGYDVMAPLVEKAIARATGGTRGE